LRQREGLPTSIGVERRKASGERAVADASDQETIDRVAGYYEKAAASDPKNVAALVGMSEVYFEQGRVQSAGKALAQARWIAPKDAGVQNALGRLFIRKGRDDLAYDAFNDAIKADPDNVAARMNLETIATAGGGPLPKRPSLAPGGSIANKPADFKF
jgi:cytochrome c-type biogenesis protein CcmH/NrfG